MPPAADRSAVLLWRVRMLHTVAWAVFAGAIVAIPVLTLAGHLHAAAWLSAFVWIEVLILLANRMTCPLTGMARAYTDDRRDNFDIFLPEWLARHNKLLFGSVFVAAEALLAWRWMAS